LRDTIARLLEPPFRRKSVNIYNTWSLARLLEMTQNKTSHKNLNISNNIAKNLELVVFKREYVGLRLARFGSSFC
jgi:hypothetical protein